MKSRFLLIGDEVTEVTTLFTFLGKQYPSTKMINHLRDHLAHLSLA